MTPKALFKNAALQNELNDKGYVTLPFIGESELEELRAFYSDIHPHGAPEKIDGIHMTTWCKDFDYKMNVANRLTELYKESCERVFEDFRTLNNVFIVKDSGETPFKVHQDWNVVDEIENFAVNVWIPLYDITKTEGGLWVVEGSHKIDRHVRGSAYLFPNYTRFNDQLEKSAKSVSLKAGEAIIFYINIIHGSPPNYGERERIATCFSVIPKDAPLTVYFQKKSGDALEVHSPKDTFMYEYEHLRTESFERSPTESPLHVLESYVNHPIRLEELQIATPQIEEKKSFWKKLFLG